MDFMPVNVASPDNVLDPAAIELLSAPDILHQPAALEPSPKTSKDVIRRSLKASTLDGVFAAVFSNITGGVLLSNFLLELGGTSTQIGLLSSIPMLANLVQPIGAYLSERTTSRHLYCLWIYGISRLFWVILAVGIFVTSWQQLSLDHLLWLTLGITAVSHLLGAFGSASWLSWMAVIVPPRLRGRYFSFRNSAANLINLICVPLLGLIVATWFSGSLQGYGIVLILGIICGFVSLSFQFWIVDVNPQLQHTLPLEPDHEAIAPVAANPPSFLTTLLYILRDRNFLMFLLYFNLWMFSVSMSGPFFNLYLLDNLRLSIGQVTIYNSLTPGANLLMLVFWGKLADRIGNRPILLGVGILVAITPLLWVLAGTDSVSIWLWIPFLHILAGATWAAIDLCTNNLQLGVAPMQNQSTYFGIVAAVAGVSGALGTTAGGFLAQMDWVGGLLGLFALSSILRLFALLPLLFVHEQRSQPLHQLMRVLFPKAA